MKLYDVPRGSYVKILEEDKVPIASLPVKTDDIIFFSRIDGMYSFCKNSNGDTIHPAAWTEVAIVDEAGKIIKQ